MENKKEHLKKRGYEVNTVFDINALDRIVKDTLEAIERSKNQIYDIAENSRIELIRVSQELNEVKNEVADIIKQVDHKAVIEKKARTRLMEVSKDLQRFTEKDIKDAYDQAYQLQVELIKMQEKEKLLRYRRDHLEASLRRLSTTVDRAEKLVSQVGVVLNYLGGGLQELGSKIGEVHQAQQMAMSIIRAQEEERKRVAREIHDGPAQSMANIVMRAEYCQKLLDLQPERVRGELFALQELVRSSLTDVRKIIFDLRPMVLDDLGLAPAIKRYLSDYNDQFDVQVEFLFIGQQKRLESSVEVALFRIIQEAVNNIKKHARAKNALVKMEMLPDKVNIHIKDDGIGFDLSKVMADGERDGYGLIGIRERVQLLKGGFDISTAPGKGTSIGISVPVDYN
ncbi:sensor histidine kinase [Pelotomaculum terephthalicicum JT]|uniref:sensor histidine kinase n=1 Tax=Pelotomaculum TaxID=191373 RepID=UPI0009C851F7|nr:MULTISPECIES: sensor histidine kinase [Pelotomaculum]MCG9966477.1 sensor histidine kinase [Pelotomaculum terephthalicicum JT]OPX85974.1 MAG: Signal transduction histidine-protein kinase/phosphatase DegS [Pelotomaculum sp. PtaB.Bin117]OPY63382.1 MAG: Signal transduction histidine-protein kinase/phosphatase DegS [Pelotomaculum sp. PtaU1.Bin065]